MTKCDNLLEILMNIMFVKKKVELHPIKPCLHLFTFKEKIKL